MRNPERINPIMAKLDAAWQQCPDLRFGQLVLNILGTDGPNGSAHTVDADEAYTTEDEIFEAKLDTFIENLTDAKRNPQPSTPDYHETKQVGDA